MSLLEEDTQGPLSEKDMQALLLQLTTDKQFMDLIINKIMENKAYQIKLFENVRIAGLTPPGIATDLAECRLQNKELNDNNAKLEKQISDIRKERGKIDAKLAKFERDNATLLKESQSTNTTFDTLTKTCATQINVANVENERLKNLNEQIGEELAKLKSLDVNFYKGVISSLYKQTGGFPLDKYDIQNRYIQVRHNIRKLHNYKKIL